MKVYLLVLGVGGLGEYMVDFFFLEDDFSLVFGNCYFLLCNVEEISFLLFGGDSDDVKVDYNWENCFGSLEDVDILFR